MSRIPTPSRVDLAADIADSTRYPPGWRTPYVRGKGTAPPPADLSDASDWFAERVVATEGGSYIAGVPPMDGSDDEFRTAAFVAIPSVAAAVSRAMGDGAKITVLTEGTAFDPDGGGKPRDESELVAATVSGAARKTGAAVPSFDTWDDDPVNVYDPKSTVWDRLAEATGDRDVARAAIAARMLSVGATVEDLRDVGILDDGSAPRFEELTGRKVPKKVTDGIRSDLRRMVHPHEHDGDPTVVSAVSALYDSMRASNLLRKVHEVERDGGVAIAVVPPWMGYALKPVIARQNKRERNRRKQASIDLEMAWGRKLVAKTFDESVEGKKFKNPETGRQVLFKSLPSDEQAKIRSQWDSRSKGDSEHSDGAKAAARETAVRIVEGIDRPKGWRSSGDEPNLTDENRKMWEAEHSAKTPGGSVLLGTTHMDVEDATTGAMSHADPTAKASFKEHVINGAVDAAKAAMKAGKKVVVLSEGTTYGDDTLDDPNDWNEQHAVAKAVHEATGGKAVQDTWDDDTVSLTNPDSDVWKRLTSAAGGDPVKAKGALAVFMAGQGQSWDSMVEDGWVDDDVAEAVTKATGTDPRGKLSKKTQQRFYDMAFPGDSGKPHTEVSAIGEVYNAARQENLLRKIREVEADGGVVIAAPGASHAYNLKGAIEGRGKTSSDLSLEMAWGWNARVAAKISEIMSGINPKVVSGAKSVTPKLKRADPNNAMWTYTVPGSKGETYTVKVKGLPRGNLRAVSKMDVEVSCSCPFFRYQGPEHWAKVGDYLYGKPAGTATRPDQKDPDGRNRVCKHVAAVFERAGNMFYTPPKGKKAASEGRTFKSVGSVRTGAGNAQVVFDPEVTTEGTARRALQFIKSIPTRDLSMSAARRFEIFDNPEDVSQRLDEVGIVADDLSNGAFDFRTGIVYACVWDGYASSLRTLMHEIGHSIVGRDEAMAESWYANRQHMDAKWAGFDRAGNMSHTPPKGRTAASTPVPDRFAPNEAGVMTRDEYIRHLNPDDRFHPSTAYNYSTFDLNERYARRHLGTVRRTYRPTLKVEGSTSGTLFIDEDDRPVAVLHGGTLYHDDRGEGIPDEYHPAGRGEPVPLDIRDRRRVKYIAEYVAKVDDLARRTATRYPVVLRRFVHGGEPMTLRAEKQPVPDKGVNLVVADSAGRILGVAQNEWGATLIAVARDARGRGIGAILSKVWHELNPSFGSGGMTGAGNALMRSVWADRVREFLSLGWYTQMVRDGRMTPERVREILADLPGRRPQPAAPQPAAPRPAAPRPMVMSDGETFVTVYDRAVLDDPGAFASDPDDDMVYGHAFLRDAPGVGTFVYSIEYDRRFAELTTRAILQLARDNGYRLYVGDRGYHDPLEGVESIPGVTVDGDYLTVGSDVLPLRSMAELERRTRRPVDPHGEVEVALMERADAKWR